MRGRTWILMLGVVCECVFGQTEAAQADGEAGRSAARIKQEFAARFIVAKKKGYVARGCGFDMNRNGVPGEVADRVVGNGKTRDPDGDGVDEDILYVDSRSGNDETGNGSPQKPFGTIQKALDTTDGPQDGAEDIICISGVFHETLVMRHGGVPGHYARDGFGFPKNPAMIIGWDKDGDGEYPPYDQDDTAVLHGQGTLAWAVNNATKLSHLEIAHLTVKNYGYREDNCGAFNLFRWGDGSQSHIYLHDVEMVAINKGEKDRSGKIVLSFWGGPMTDVAVVNNLVDEYSSYFCRGAPPDGSGRFRFQNNTLRMYGIRGGSFVTGWKLWGHHRGVEIVDNVIDCNATAWKPTGHVSGIGVCQGTQNWTIRGNVLIDVPVTLQPFARGYPFQRTLQNIVIDRNVFRATYDGWAWPRHGINIQGYPDAPANQTVEDVTITNNFFSAATGGGQNVSVDYAPKHFRADGNVYDEAGGFRWNETKHWRSVPAAAWRSATGQDLRSRTGAPEFIDTLAGDLHLRRSDTIAIGGGVDITTITSVDIDGQPRTATRPVAGADVPGKNDGGRPDE